MAPKKQTAFRLSEAQIKRLDKLAKKLECSRAAVVRQAINLLAKSEGIR